MEPTPQKDEPDSSEPHSGLEEARMAVWEHLDELRSALVRSLIAVGICFGVTYYFSDHIVYFLELPLLKILPPGSNLYFTGIADKFTMYFKVSLMSAGFMALPVILHQLWGFISPALYAHERKFAVPFIFFGSFAFFVGLAFAYYIVIPYGYKFLIEFGTENALSTEKPLITMTEYFGLTTRLLLAVGLIFETPVLLILLGKFGLVNSKMLVKFRKHAFLLSALVAAIATPSPDAFTMLIVMSPLYALYEVSIVGVRFTGKNH